MNETRPPEKPVIAVVDDDPSVLRALDRLIRSHGALARLFSSAADSMQPPGAAAADCLILDVQMPGMGGLDLHERFRERGCRCPVIFITAHEDPDAEARAARSGAAGFLYKPFRNDVLWGAVTKALERDTAAEAP